MLGNASEQPLSEQGSDQCAERGDEDENPDPLDVSTLSDKVSRHARPVDDDAHGSRSSDKSFFTEIKADSKTCNGRDGAGNRRRDKEDRAEDHLVASTTSSGTAVMVTSRTRAR